MSRHLGIVPNPSEIICAELTSLTCYISLFIRVCVIGKVDDGHNDEANGEKRSGRIEECPGDVLVPAPLDVEQLQWQEQEQDGRREVDERGLLEAPGQVRAVRIPGQVGIPKRISAERGHFWPRCLNANDAICKWWRTQTSVMKGVMQ